MRLELDSDDLLPEFAEIPCRRLKVNHFHEDVRQAIAVVGKATFYRDKGTHLENYTVVYSVATGREMSNYYLVRDGDGVGFVRISKVRWGWFDTRYWICIAAPWLCRIADKETLPSDARTMREALAIAATLRGCNISKLSVERYKQ